MAFMMPLVKQNYSLYTNGNPPPAKTGQLAAGANCRRRSTDQTDRRASGHRAVLRRNAKSEGTSLSTSPAGCSDMHHPTHVQGGQQPSCNYSKPLEIRRGRFSVPTFLSLQTSFRSKPKLRQMNSMPAGGKSPPAKPKFSPSPRSSVSSTSSSESMKTNKNFHTRLILRLRKTLGFGHKESCPTSS